MTLEEATDKFIDAIEAGSHFRCPKENRKNGYTKACWLLSFAQGANNAAHGQDQEIKDFVVYLTKRLPKIRADFAQKQPRKD